MKRDKVITLRVNEELYNKVKEIIDLNTECYETWKTKRYYNRLSGKYKNFDRFYCKFSLADLLEIAMKEFIRDLLQ